MYNRYQFNKKVEAIKLEKQINAQKQVIPLNYGDKVEYTMIDANKNTDVYTIFSDKIFKYIYIYNVKNKMIGMDSFVDFIDIMKSINNNNISFYYIIIGKTEDIDVSKYNALKELYHFNIISASDSLITRLFKVTSIKNSYQILLDENNTVRLFGDLPPNDVKELMQKEIQSNKRKVVK
jgi:hypothetical protein